MLVTRYRFVGAVPRLCNQEFGPPVQSAQRRQPWAQHVLVLNIGIDVFVSAQKIRVHAQKLVVINATTRVAEEKAMSLGTILLIILVLMLIGAIPTWPHSRNWGYYPTGGLGIVLIVVVVLLVAGRL